ncbi:hypothetical protein [Rhodoferax sp.]|uniref:hypothetical protein n=1 Tax=Rhodoferax sp. TaxID=50421 RepID=UPI002615F0CE|nr:hypothetical protein [Rhodoferax sp.]MDD2811120.1 hypothetical protein [Rhodoferax sp.]MDD4945046.1 hypothetical protein [Rhodoferax sp.]
MPYQQYLTTLSGPRTGVYKRVFRTQTPEETAGAMLWGQAVAMALQPLLVSFEVVLRNRIHASLSSQASEQTGTPCTSFAWYDQQSGWHKLEGETFNKVEKLLNDDLGIRLAVPPSPDRVVSGLSFGVWTNILDAQLPTPPVQARTFREVFPNHPKAKKHWGHGDNRKAAVAIVKDVRLWRNRISHCKPVWSEGWYRNSPTQHWSDVLRRVASRRLELLEVLGWMCPQTVDVYRRGFAGRLFDGLIAEDAMYDFVHTQLAAATGPTYPTPADAALQAYRVRP